MKRTAEPKQTYLQTLLIERCRSGIELSDSIFATDICLDFLDDKYGMSPLMHAAMFNHAESLQKLLIRSANPDVVDNIHFTALHYAVSSYNTNQDNDNALSPQLHAALRNAMVRELIAFGADVNAGDHQGQTPLHIALNNNNILSAIQLIKDGNANPFLRNQDGISPFQLMLDKIESLTNMQQLTLQYAPAQAESYVVPLKLLTELGELMEKSPYVKALCTAQDMMNGSLVFAQQWRQQPQLFLPDDLCHKILAYTFLELSELSAINLAKELLDTQKVSKANVAIFDPEELPERKLAAKTSFTEKYLEELNQSSGKAVSL